MLFWTMGVEWIRGSYWMPSSLEVAPVTMLGWSSQPNLEILCRAGEDFDSWSFQRELLNGAREMSDGEFHRWESIARVTKGKEGAITGSQGSVSFQVKT